MQNQIMFGTSFVRSLALVMFVLCCAGVALADDDMWKPTNAKAREHLTAGIRLYGLREFEAAIKEYKAGALIDDAPAFAYSLGQAYRKLGKYEDSIWHYRRFLARARPLPAEYKEGIEKLIGEMQSEMEHRAMTAPPTEAAPENKPEPKAVPAQVTPTPIMVAEEEASPWYADGFGWGLAGTGAAACGVSIGLLLNAKGLDEDANGESSQTRRDELRDQADSRRLAGGIVGVTGAALLVTGIIKLAIAPTKRAQSVSVGIARNGIVVMGRF